MSRTESQQPGAIDLKKSASQMVSNSSPLLSPSSPQPTFYSAIDDDDDNEEETSKIIEESPNGHWSKLMSEISTQKLLDFDSANLAIDSVR